MLMYVHARHTSGDVAATAVDSVRGPHFVQELEPYTSLYVPATHAVHGPPTAPVYPGGHRHAAAEVLPTRETLLAGHGVHASALCLSLNVFSAQAAHGFPVCPAAHVNVYVFARPGTDTAVRCGAPVPVVTIETKQLAPYVENLLQYVSCVVPFGNVFCMQAESHASQSPEQHSASQAVCISAYTVYMVVGDNS